eukprot:7643955-Prorocentrum_lima.AAC.1
MADFEEQLKKELAQSQPIPLQMQNTQRQYDRARQAKEKAHTLLVSKKAAWEKLTQQIAEMEEY